MKKFLMGAALLLTCLSLQAAYTDPGNKNYSGYYLHLPGNHNNWDVKTSIGLNSAGVGIWENYAFNGNDFKLYFWDGSSNYWRSNGSSSLSTETWISITGNSDNNMKISGDKSGTSYDLFWDQRGEKLWISPKDPSKMYIVGQVNGKDWNPSNGVALNRTSSKVYSGEVEIGLETGMGYFSFSYTLGTTTDGTNNNWNGLVKRMGAKNNDYALNTNDEADIQDGENAFRVASGRYKVTLNLNTKKVKLELIQLKYPDQLYMIGDINDNDWSVVDAYSAKNQNGLYYFNSVSIYGNNDDPNHNYFTFFYNHENGSKNYDDKLPRVTSLRGYNDQGGGNNHEFGTLVSGTWYRADADVHCYNEPNTVNEYNFKIDKGYYDVIVDLTVPEVRIKLADPISFDWHNGSGIALKDGDFDNIEDTDYQHGEDNPDIDNYGLYTVNYQEGGRRIQVGVEGLANHNAANNAKFIVERRNDPAAINGKKNVTPGYTDVTNDKNIVEISSDNIITIKKVGTYNITATTAGTSVAGVYNAGGVEPTSTITMVMNPMSVNASINADVSVPFNAQGATVLPKAVYLDAKVAYGTDFTISLTPYDGTNDNYWVKPGDAANLTQSYQEALAGPGDNGLVTQFNSIGGTNVDGFYTQIGTITATLASDTPEVDGYYAYNVSAEVPCSGVYTLNVIPASNSNFTVKDATTEVEVYPNLFGTFGNTNSASQQYEDKGFNVNGYTFSAAPSDGDATATIKIPSTMTVDQLKRCIGFIPGNYFVNSLSTSAAPVTESSNGILSDSKLRVNAYTAPYRMDLDLSNTTDFTVTIAKNGAEHTFNFAVESAASGFNTSTGVETIGSEADGEAVYFNLQGVKVANPDHGVYVKVQNGKASKVVL